MHGGKSLQGAASPTFKNGDHSKFLPERLRRVYQEALENPDLIRVKRDIALIDALIIDNLQSLDSAAGEHGQFWEEALEQIRWARQAYKTENYGGLERSLDELEALADRRRLHFAAEREIREKVEQRRKLVETEQKINLQGERAVSVTELMTFMGALLELINRVVDDNPKRTELVKGINGLLGQNARLQ